VQILVKRLGRLCPFDQVFALSATEGYGTTALRSHLVESALPQPWELPAGAPTDQSWKDLAAELVREKCFWAFNKELPYRLLPVCTRCQEFQGNKVEVDVVRLLSNFRSARYLVEHEQTRPAQTRHLSS
jgi:GTPase Era involved in 16S rRNA processing